MELTVTVGIPTYMRDKLLVDTICQVLEQRPAADEVIVVDQTLVHDRDTEEFLREHEARGTIKRFLQYRPSLTEANNRILAESRCDLVLFLDDDIQLLPGLIGTHRKCYEGSDIRLVAGSVLLPGESESQQPHAEANQVIPLSDPANQLRGCNMSMVRLDAIKAGGFDENFVGPAHGNEIDFSIRLARRVGGRQVFHPGACLIHLKAPTGGCRIDKSQNPAWDEWERSYNIWLFGFRHDWPHNLEFVKRAFRIGPRRKENVIRPWRQPLAWASFVYAAWTGWRRVDKTRSPFATSQGR